jgi:hypothetical protein
MLVEGGGGQNNVDGISSTSQDTLYVTLSRTYWFPIYNFEQVQKCFCYP